MANLLNVWILPIAVFPGLVFIEKLQIDDLTMTNFVALRPNDDHLKVSGGPVSGFALFYHNFFGF